MQISRSRENRGKSTGLVPDYFAENVLDIDFAILHEQGIKKIAIDVDQTLANHKGIEVTPEIANYLNAQVASGTIEEIIIASNSLRDLSAFTDRLNAKIVIASARTRKPRKRYFDEVCRVAKCKPQQMAMIGDRILTDILGGNRAGMTTILVKPWGPDMIVERLIPRRFWGERYLRRHKRP
jgi:hypothetical protein